jgi:hypothetical protein
MNILNKKIYQKGDIVIDYSFWKLLFKVIQLDSIHFINNELVNHSSLNVIIAFSRLISLKNILITNSD